MWMGDGLGLIECSHWVFNIKMFIFNHRLQNLNFGISSSFLNWNTIIIQCYFCSIYVLVEIVIHKAFMYLHLNLALQGSEVLFLFSGH